MRKLTLPLNSPTAYTIKDGDIPCTPEIEPTYSYVWNFCSAIPTSSDPSFCNKTGISLQYLVRASDGYKECHVIGTYDPKQDDLIYSLLDPSDPSKGVSMRYGNGDRCEAFKTKGVYRSTTLDVQCANVKMSILSATEPNTCQYHMLLKSYYGCPAVRSYSHFLQSPHLLLHHFSSFVFSSFLSFISTLLLFLFIVHHPFSPLQECPITSNGLCDSHGYCRFDKLKKKSYCYCNQGYSGDSCGTRGGGAQAAIYDGHSVQVGLTATLLVVTLALLAVVGYMIWRVAEYRKEQAYASLSSGYLSGGGGGSAEMTTVNF